MNSFCQQDGYCHCIFESLPCARPCGYTKIKGFPHLCQETLGRRREAQESNVYEGNRSNASHKGSKGVAGKSYRKDVWSMEVIGIGFSLIHLYRYSIYICLFGHDFIHSAVKLSPIKFISCTCVVLSVIVCSVGCMVLTVWSVMFRVCDLTVVLCMWYFVCDVECMLLSGC